MLLLFLVCERERAKKQWRVRVRYARRTIYTIASFLSLFVFPDLGPLFFFHEKSMAHLSTILTVVNKINNG